MALFFGEIMMERVKKIVSENERSKVFGWIMTQRDAGVFVDQMTFKHRPPRPPGYLEDFHIGEGGGLSIDSVTVQEPPIYTLSCTQNIADQLQRDRIVRFLDDQPPNLLYFPGVEPRD